MIIWGSRKGSTQSASSKEWWYLLALVGLFGMLSYQISFTAILLIFTIASGVLWGWERFFLLKQKKNVALEAVEISNQCDSEGLETIKIEQVVNMPQQRPFVSFMSGIFPIILFVFVVRSFIVEPFQIPSSSMRPGLVVGDFILVNKFSYGIRLPILNNVIVPVGKVERGDVVVFNYPPDPKVNYIKRVIGLPGDTVEYKDKVLFINGKEIQKIPDGMGEYINEFNGKISYNLQFKEAIGTKNIKTFNIENWPAVILSEITQFPHVDQCQYNDDSSGFICKVPKGQYFMMGDNRDNSLDSRYWGFVDDRLLVGKAFFVWMNFRDFNRIGSIIR